MFRFATAPLLVLVIAASSYESVTAIRSLRKIDHDDINRNDDSGEDEDHHGVRKAISVSKGIQCNATSGKPMLFDYDKNELSFVKEDEHRKGRGRHMFFGCMTCKGCLRSKFSCGSKANDIVNHISTNLQDQMKDVALPTIEDLHPSKDVVERMIMFDDGDVADEYKDASTDEDEEGGKTIKFGGMVKANWACKVTFSVDKSKKFSKTSECEMQLHSGAGSAPTAGDDNQQQMDSATGNGDSALLATIFNDGSILPHHGGGGKKSFSIQKGIECNATRKDWHGCLGCEGGMKSIFSCDAKASDILSHLATNLHNQMSEVFIPPSEDLKPNDETMNAMIAFDDVTGDMLDPEDEGISKTFEFGGIVKAQWGCMVTYMKKEGNKDLLNTFQKLAECGFKAHHNAGPKESSVGAIQDEDDTMMD